MHPSHALESPVCCVCLSCVQGGVLVDLWQLKFAGPPPPPKPERVLTGACQSVGKRHKKATAEVRGHSALDCDCCWAAQLSS
jgi:hypothetical protein